MIDPDLQSVASANDAVILLRADYDALIAALREAERLLDYFTEGRTLFVFAPSEPLKCLAQVRAALAKAGGAP